MNLTVGGDLVLGTENMRIILGKGPHPRRPVQGTDGSFH